MSKYKVLTQEMGIDKERVLSRVAPDPNSGCWLWTGYVDINGYGIFALGRGKNMKAHRVSYTLLKGNIPEGLQLDHLCRVRCCVNPDHLEPVTPAENTRRSKVGEFQRSKTHCPQGHPYKGDNLYIKPDGARDCRSCRNEASKRYKEKLN